MVLAAASMIVLSASFGLFITSLLKDTRQSGIVYGGVLTMMGMVGMIGYSPPRCPALPRSARDCLAVGAAGLGRARLADDQAGGGLGDVLVTLLVMLGLAAIFFTVACSGSASGSRRRLPCVS